MAYQGKGAGGNRAYNEIRLLSPSAKKRFFTAVMRCVPARLPAACLTLFLAVNEEEKA